MRIHGDGDLTAPEPRHSLPDLAHHPEGDALAGEHVAAALTVAAGFTQRLHEVLAGSLTRHLDEAQLRDLQDIRPRFVRSERLLQCAVYLLPVRRRLHVDQVDDDQAAEISEAQLMHDLLDGLEVGLEHGLLKIALADEATRVHVDRSQRFALVDHE